MARANRGASSTSPPTRSRWSSRAGPRPLLPPIEEAWNGLVGERQAAQIAELIEKLKDLFHGELTDQDKLVYVNDVLMGKLLESNTLRQQAANNSKQQFATVTPEDSLEMLADTPGGPGRYRRSPRGATGIGAGPA